MSLSEATIQIPAEYISNVFGQFDVHIKKIDYDKKKIKLVIR